MKDPIHLLDVVAVLENISERGIYRGQVGTVVELLADGVFEVEFSDNEGCSYAMFALSANQLMVVHYGPIKVS